MPLADSRANVPFTGLMILVRSRWGRLACSSAIVGGGRLAVLPLTAEPAEKRAFQVLGREAIGFGAPVLPRHGNTRGINDMSLDAAFNNGGGSRVGLEL